MWEGIRGSTNKEYQKLDTATQGDQIPRQSIEQIGMCLGTYGYVTLRALAALVGSSQGLQLTRVLTFQSCLDSSQSRCGHEDYKPSDCQTANGARLQIEYYVHTRIPGPYINISAPHALIRSVLNRTLEIARDGMLGGLHELQCGTIAGRPGIVCALADSTA